MSRLMSQPAASPASAATAADGQTPAANSNSTVHTRRANGLPPEIIEVEPVAGSEAAVMFQALGIAPHQALDPRIALPPVDLRQVREPLDMDLIPVAAAVEPEHQRHRPLQHGRNADRPGRETSLLAEKMAGNRPSAFKRPVRQHPDDFAARQGGFDFQYGIHPAQ